MLKLQPEPTFTINVTVPVAGAPDELINCTFAYKDKDELIDWVKKIENGYNDAIKDILTGWDNVDADFTPQNLALICRKRPTFAKVVCEAYSLEVGKAPAKN